MPVRVGSSGTEKARTTLPEQGSRRPPGIGRGRGATTGRQQQRPGGRKTGRPIRDGVSRMPPVASHQSPAPVRLPGIRNNTEALKSSPSSPISIGAATRPMKQLPQIRTSGWCGSAKNQNQRSSANQTPSAANESLA